MKYIYIILLLVMGLEGFAQMKPDSSWTLKNLQEVNSKNNDYLPFWVDSLLLFTSDRKSAPEGQTLEHSEKVYFSSFRDQIWSKVKKDGYNSTQTTTPHWLELVRIAFIFTDPIGRTMGNSFLLKGSKIPKNHIRLEN